MRIVEIDHKWAAPLKIRPRTDRIIIHHAASAGDVQAYAALVQAALNLTRVVAANDRAAMIAAVMLTQSGVSRPQLDVIDGGE